jgi:ferrous iron transport protein B
MKLIALLGMPNTGKSTLFNRLSGRSARVGNWPGITVSLLRARILVGNSMAELVDLPGIYDLHGYADDERLVRHFLENQPIDLAVVLLNANQLDRQLFLTLQLQELGFPVLVVVNMIDETRRLGVRIDLEALSAGLELPVVGISAKFGEGHNQMLQAMSAALHRPADAEQDAVPDPRERLRADDALEARVEELLKSSVARPLHLPESISERVDHVLMHPWLGIPFFFLAMFAVFSGVFWLGSPIQDLMKLGFHLLETDFLVPALASAPPMLSGFLIEGLYAGLATVTSFVPLIVLFFFFMAIVEDSGYLSRAAYLMDALMVRLGLDGRSFVMMLMGFGCNVPAIMGTRVMRSRALRLLSMMVIPFSLCSARLQVFLFIIGALFTAQQAPLVLLSLYLFSFATAFLTALGFQHSPAFKSDEPFVVELPPYRLPTLQQVWSRGWLEVRHFVMRAAKIIVSGVVLVWLLTHFPTGVTPASPESYAGMIGKALAPVLNPLGIDDRLAVALIFGFVAKEVVIGALAVIYGLEGDALVTHVSQVMNWMQAYSFMLFTLIYTPCLSTVAAIRTESKSLGFTVLAVIWPLALAWLVSFVFYQLAIRYFSG